MKTALGDLNLFIFIDDAGQFYFGSDEACTRNTFTIKNETKTKLKAAGHLFFITDLNVN
jgi:hypothetical protein